MSQSIGSVAFKHADGTVAYTGVLSTVTKTKGFTLTDDFKKLELTDGGGKRMGREGHDREHKMSVDVLFYSTSEALAKSVVKFPEQMFAIVTIADTGIAAINGDWNYERGVLTLRTDEYHVFSIDLWRGGSDTTPAAFPIAT